MITKDYQLMEISVLLKVSDLKEEGRYIQVVYIEYINFQQASFQVQFILANFSTVVSTEANNIFIRVRNNNINRVACERNMETKKKNRNL